MQIFSYHHVHRKSYKILNFENMVKIWPAFVRPGQFNILVY